jgi:hypothetical protein
VAVHPEDVEYILCVDERWGFRPDGIISPMRSQDTLVWNTGRQCYVDGVNAAAAVATGQILIVNADDQFPCGGWDVALLRLIDTRLGIERSVVETVVPAVSQILDKPGIEGEFVIWVSTGTPLECERRIIVLPILSRARYERYGYVFYPEFESMYADNDLMEQAERDGVIIDGSHLMFPHRHPICDGVPIGEWDAVYQAQNRPEAYRLGQRVIAKRRAERSGMVQMPQNERPIIACCLPGENFSMFWVDCWTRLVGHMMHSFGLTMNFGHTSSVYAIRHLLTDLVLHHSGELKVDFVLWIDDDNLLVPEHFDLLYQDLVEHPEVDMVAGYCGIAVNGPQTAAKASAGRIVDNKCVPLTRAEILAAPSDLIEVEYTGFPVVLMRYETLVKAGNKPFAPIVGDEYEYGLSGEDTAFCIHARERGGCRIFIDRRVKVPHLKLRSVDPEDIGVEQMEMVS